MQYKHKILFALVKVFNLNIDDITIIQTTCHIFVQNNKDKLKDKFCYDFINGYSYEMANDLEHFISKNLYDNQKDYIKMLELEDRFIIRDFCNNYHNKTSSEQQINQENLPNKLISKTLFTLGYEGISIDAYIKKLLDNNIACLIDVRKNAYSNKFGFKKAELSNILSQNEISYYHIPELGIDSDKRKEAGVLANNKIKENDLFYNKDKELSKLFAHYQNELDNKQKYLDLILTFCDKYNRIAITCFEQKYNECHRHIIASNLQDRVKIVHL